MQCHTLAIGGVLKTTPNLKYLVCNEDPINRSEQRTLAVWLSAAYRRGCGRVCAWGTALSYTGGACNGKLNVSQRRCSFDRFYRVSKAVSPMNLRRELVRGFLACSLTALVRAGRGSYGGVELLPGSEGCAYAVPCSTFECVTGIISLQAWGVLESLGSKQEDQGVLKQELSPSAPSQAAGTAAATCQLVDEHLPSREALDLDRDEASGTCADGAALGELETERGPAPGKSEDVPAHRDRPTGSPSSRFAETSPISALVLRAGGGFFFVRHKSRSE